MCRAPDGLHVLTGGRKGLPEELKEPEVTWPLDLPLRPWASLCAPEPAQTPPSTPQVLRQPLFPVDIKFLGNHPNSNASFVLIPRPGVPLRASHREPRQHGAQCPLSCYQMPPDTAEVKDTGTPARVPAKPHLGSPSKHLGGWRLASTFTNTAGGAGPPAPASCSCPAIAL